MPIYEYECEECGIVEAIQKFGADELQACPACGKKGVKKIISASAFHLKGGGWYKTDYTSSGKTDSKKSEKKTEKTADKSNKDQAAPKQSCGSACKCH